MSGVWEVWFKLIIFHVNLALTNTSNGGSRRPKKIVKVWSMMLAVMTVAVKVDVAAAVAAAAAVGMLATILVLLVASLPFTCLLQQLEPTLSWNSSFSKRKKRQKNSPLGNRQLKSALVFTKMFRIITNTPKSNFSKMRDHRKAQKKHENANSRFWKVTFSQKRS